LIKRPIGTTGFQANWQAAIPVVALLLFWQLLSSSGIVPGYMLPSPIRVTAAFAADFPLLMGHLGVPCWKRLQVWRWQWRRPLYWQFSWTRTAF